MGLVSIDTGLTGQGGKAGCCMGSDRLLFALYPLDSWLTAHPTLGSGR